MEAVLKPRRVWLAVLGVVSFALAGLGAFAALPSGATDASSMALMELSWGRPTQAERTQNKLYFWNDPTTATATMEILVYVDGMEPGKEYEIFVEVKEKGGLEEIKMELEVEDLIGEQVPVLPPPDPRN